MQYTNSNLLIQPQQFPDDPDLLLSITPAQAGWKLISFQVRQLATAKLGQ